MYRDYEVKNTTSIPDFGTGFLNDLLLSQYQSSPILRAYMLAYVEEMDLLFEEAQKMYEGRMIEYAVGAQLDVIGEILGQGRGIVLPFVHFGFVGAPGLVAGMADEITPNLGGVFRDGSQPLLESQPLDDANYRRLLRVKAFCNTEFYRSIDFVYDMCGILLNRNPATFTITEDSPRAVTLTLGTSEVAGTEAQLILYMSRHFMPAGTLLQVTLI